MSDEKTMGQVIPIDEARIQESSRRDGSRDGGAEIRPSFCAKELAKKVRVLRCRLFKAVSCKEPLEAGVVGRF